MPGADAHYGEVHPVFDAVVYANADRILRATDWTHNATKKAMPDDLLLAEVASSWLGANDIRRDKILVRNAV